MTVEIQWMVVITGLSLVVSTIALVTSLRARAALEKERATREELKEIKEQWDKAFAAGEEHRRAADEVKGLEQRLKRVEGLVYTRGEGEAQDG